LQKYKENLNQRKIEEEVYAKRKKTMRKFGKQEMIPEK
jgi:hypothetical protein